MALILSGTMGSIDSEPAYFARLEIADYLMAGSGLLLNLISALYLFSLQKLSVPIFGLVALFNCASFLTDYLDARFALSQGSIYLGLLYGPAVFLYSSRLRKKGLLF